MDRSLAEQLVRKGSGSNQEPFEKYSHRVHAIFPDIPDDVLEQWWFRHADAVGEWDWLEPSDLVFREESWLTEELLHEVRARYPETIDARKKSFFDSWSGMSASTSSLGKQMLEDGTWPTPIIVMQAAGVSAPQRARLKEPYTLVEGHRRFGFLQALAERGEAKGVHRVWVISAKP